MKFVKSLITILAVSNTLAYTVPIIKRDEIDNALAEFDNNTNAAQGQINSLDGQNKINAFNQADGNQQNSNGNISEQCKNVLNQYKDCFEKLTEANYDKVCDTFNSPQCQNLIKKKITDNEGCKDLNENDSLGFQNLINVSVINKNLSCAKNEKNEYCPIALYGKSLEEKEISDDVINETCKYKSCRDKAVESFTLYIELNKQYSSQSNLVKRKSMELNEIETLLEKLNKEQCVKQAKQASESDAYSINVKNTLLITFGLFFILFI